MNPSILFSVFSMIFYSVVYFPQFLLIYKNKSSEGFSTLMMMLWTQADCLSLMATILLKLHINLVVIGWYHMTISFFMLIFNIIYKPTVKPTVNPLTILFIITNISIIISIQLLVSDGEPLVGTIIGWITTGLYIIGRFPQLYTNWHLKTTKHVSVYLYIFSIFGNIFYLLSIVTYSINPEYIQTNLPWIILVIGLVFLDLVFLFQSFLYKEKNNDSIELI